MQEEVGDKRLKHFLQMQQTWEISSELADTVGELLQSIIEYAKRTNIPIHEETGMWNLVRKAQSLLKLVQEVTSTTHLPLTAQRWITAPDTKRPPENATVYLPGGWRSFVWRPGYLEI